MRQIINFKDFKPFNRQLSNPRAIQPPKEDVGTFHEDSRISNLLEILRKQFPNQFAFSIEEVSKFVNVSYETIRRKIMEGKIAHFSIGDRKLINIAELARILTEGV